MQVHFYVFGKDKDSTRIPGEDSLFGIYNGTMKEPSSLLTPVIAFDLSEVPQANFFYIPDFNRYYYCRQWSYSRGMWIADMNVDVLATYRDFIGSTSAYILRSSSAYDGNVIDSSYPTKAGTHVIRTEATPQYIETGYIVQVNSNDGVKTYYMDNANFLQLCRDLWFEWRGIDGMTEVIANVTDPMQYINSVQKTYGSRTRFWVCDAAEPIHMGMLTLTAVGYPMQGTGFGYVDINVPKHPQSAARPYSKSQAYSQYSMFLPGIGYFEVPADILYNTDRLHISLEGDAYTGKLRASIESGGESGGEPGVYLDVYGNINVPWAIGASMINATGAVSSGVSTISSLFHLDVAGAINGVLSAANSCVPTVSVNGSLAGGIGFSQNPEMLLHYQNIVDEDVAKKGRPLMQKRTISTLSGYVLCENAHAEFPATSEELREVEQFLNGGFFFE